MKGWTFFRIFSTKKICRLWQFSDSDTEFLYNFIVINEKNIYRVYFEYEKISVSQKLEVMVFY